MKRLDRGTASAHAERGGATTNRVDLMFAASPTSARGFARQYLDYVAEILTHVDEVAVETICDALLAVRAAGGVVYLCGNGGSAATASHFANDLMVGVGGEPPFRAISLASNVPLLTCLSNDHGYEEVFARQLAGRVGSADALVAISASGESENVLRAVRCANAAGARTIGLTGFDGGQLRPLVDIGLHVRSATGEFGPVEDVHMVIEHAIVNFLRLAGARGHGGAAP